jgi:hypothetical protein
MADRADPVRAVQAAMRKIFYLDQTEHTAAEEQAAKEKNLRLSNPSHRLTPSTALGSR